MLCTKGEIKWLWIDAKVECCRMSDPEKRTCMQSKCSCSKCESVWCKGITSLCGFDYRFICPIDSNTLPCMLAGFGFTCCANKKCSTGCCKTIGELKA